MAPRKNAKGGGGGNSSSSGSGSGSTSAGSSGGSSSPGARRETKHGGHKNGKKGGLSGSSFFTWFMVIALLGVWTSVAVVWFELVDYEEVLGKLGIYDADGDGDFDVDDAKVLLGLKERSASEPTVPPEAEPDAELEEQAPVGAEPKNIEDEINEQIQPLLHETVHREHVEGEDLQQEDGAPVGEPHLEDDRFLTAPDVHDKSETLEPETFHEDSQDYHQDLEEKTYEQEAPDSSEPLVADGRLQHDEDGVTYQDYDEKVYEPLENEPSENEPLENEPLENEPLENEPLENEPLENEPLENEPLENEPLENEPSENNPVENELSENEPSEKERIEISDTTVYSVEDSNVIAEEVTVPLVEEQQEVPPETNRKMDDTEPKERVKKKKPKLLNKFDKTIKAELDAAEKLRKRGKIEEAADAFRELVHKYPQSPRARYGKAQCEDDLAEKRRSNELLRGAIETYREVAGLPAVPSDLLKLALKRCSDRQQFLGHMRGSLLTLQRLVQLFPNDTSLKNDLGVGYLLIGDNGNAKKVYEEVLSVTPNDGFAKVHYGFILKAQNKIAESIPYLKEGIESGDPGTDDGRFYFHLGDAMQRVGNKEAYKWYELGHKRGHFASVWQRSLYNVNGLKAQPWWTAKETGYTDLVKSLERHWKLIRDEGLAVMDKAKGLFLPEDENLREKGDWSQFTLWQQGRKNENACKGAPKTCTLLEKFPETTGCRRGQIKYSVMHPGTHVWPHTGPTNCRLRMHLGLVIPKEGCKIRCANETKSWEEGKVLIFDDSFEHEVWQDASSFRLIFIVDVWHPELTTQQRRSLPAI
ncbi:aspartyl/asparaginyl beta-hydroxylase isoform X2 [Nycticebus coucang]|uniref:aspartyl/asparaginyl beta-hydroxylase isoform X2 n=1 Tax=Nycticebus coucang TaxID=9470 RepID=UPI00234CE649|nr:aspartyl/asparaginyl beta-hydroxylase isoform X2 [Nycticebus coucang]